VPAKEKPHRIRSLAFTPEQHLGNFGDNREAQEIHDQFHIHEEGLRNKTEQRQKRARRQTQTRLKARTKLKDSKALSKIKTFSKLTETEVDKVISKMDHIVRFKGDSICHQHDASDAFYIIIKGSASVTVDVVNSMKDKEDQDEEDTAGEIFDFVGRPEQVVVASIEMLGFFGEGALVGGDEPELRTATVTVSSEKCVLLCLKRSNFLKLLKTDIFNKKSEDNDDKSIMEQMKETRMERSKSNRLLMQNRKSSRLLGGGGGGGGGGKGGGEGEVKINEKTKSTRTAPAPPVGVLDILAVNNDETTTVTIISTTSTTTENTK